MKEGYEAAVARLAARRRFGVTLGLERIRRLLAACGDPQQAFSVVHIAGTNGKGSTAAMIAAGARTAGHRTGLFTSPHLCRFSERITVDGREIPPEALCEQLARLERVAVEASFFELVTAVALAHFAACGVEVAVLETGLGGRLDATNAVRPRVSVLTQIARDHAEVLGETLGQIAAEKAGIIKPGVPVISAAGPKRVISLIAARCEELNAPLSLCGRDFDLVARRGQLIYRGSTQPLEDVQLGLAGEHQRQNGALALAAMEQLDRLGLSIPLAARRRALRELRWPGRMERVGEFLLDCAHNPAAARALARALSPQGGAGCGDRASEGYCLVFGALAGKQPGEMLAALRPLCERVLLVRPPNERGIAPRELVRHAPGAELCEDIEAALELAAADPRPKLVTGSVYLVGGVRQRLLGDAMAPTDGELSDPL